MQRFRFAIAGTFFGRVVHHAVAAAAFERGKDSLVHRAAHVGGDFMIVEMEQHEVERTVLRQGNLVERAVDDPHVRHARLLHALLQLGTRGLVSRINHSLGADQLR